MATKRKTVATERKRKRLVARALRAKKKAAREQAAKEKVAQTVAVQKLDILDVTEFDVIRDRIARRDLELIEAKQARGETLTASDRKAVQEIMTALTEKKSPGQARETVQISIEKALPMARRKAFDELNRLLETSTRDDVRLNAAKELKQWADAEEPAAEPYTLADAQPHNEKIVSITSAAG